MRKKADSPLCQNRHCKEDAPDMIEKWERKFVTEYCCKTCGQSWEVKKPIDRLLE